MNLATTYLGLPLANPIVVGASPFCDSTYVARQLQDAGAGAVILRSLFAEQIAAEAQALRSPNRLPDAAGGDQAPYFPAPAEYQLSGAAYLRQIEDLRSTLTIPVIASLNGGHRGAWTAYARRMEAAGASALELNLYHVITDPEVNGAAAEEEMLATVSAVAGSVAIPVAVKLSPFHTSPAHFAVAAERAGAAGVVLFNRFYQPDFDTDEREPVTEARLSDSGELLLRLRWLAILSPHLRGSLSASGGVQTAEDAVKAILAGADTVQVVSVLLKHGPRFLGTLLEGVRQWMSEHGYRRAEDFRGLMDHRRCPDPAAFERGGYQRILQSWKV